MKKIILSAIIVASAMTANAQAWIGGELGFNSTTYKGGSNKETLSNVTISPEIGYNLDENWAVAAKLEYSHFEDGGTANAVGINPYVRYTFAKTGNLSFFIDGGLSWTSTHYKGEDKNANTYGIGFNPGLAYAISKKVSLVAHIGDFSYNHYKFHDTKIDGFNLGLDNSISFGAYVAF